MVLGTHTTPTIGAEEVQHPEDFTLVGILEISLVGEEDMEEIFLVEVMDQEVIQIHLVAILIIPADRLPEGASQLVPVCKCSPTTTYQNCLLSL